MTPLRANLLANFLGKGWGAAMGILFIPIYVAFVGMESFGLIAFNATIFAVFSLFDMGISSTLNREMARLTGAPGGADEARDLLKTLQSVYFLAAIMTATSIALLAPIISHHWLQTSVLDKSQVANVIMLMGLVISTQMLFGFYMGGILGLQHQVLSNALIAAVGTVRAVGSIAVLWAVSPTVLAFFVWQAICGIVSVLLAAAVLWRKLGGAAGRSKFRMDLLFSSGRFAAGMGATSIISLLLTQTDKVILSKLLSLESFGYYALAGAMASALNYLGSPVITAFFPTLTQRYASADAVGLEEQYHNATQILAVAVLPAAGILVAFPGEVLFGWTGNPTTVHESSNLLLLLSLSTALNVLASVPYCLQMAHGWTRLGLLLNTATVLAITPALVLAVTRWGAFGAAAVLAAVNAIYLLVFVHLMHRRILPGRQWRWYAEDILPAACAVAGVAIVAKLFVTASEHRYVIIVHLAAVYLVMLACAAWSAPRIRFAIKNGCPLRRRP